MPQFFFVLAIFKHPVYSRYVNVFNLKIHLVHFCFFLTAPENLFSSNQHKKINRLV
jgi:hypothetical protein